MENKLNIKEKPSRIWYLLAIFLNVIGGIIGYFLLKDKDRKFAERLLIVGVIMIVVDLLLLFTITYFSMNLWVKSYRNVGTQTIGNQENRYIKCTYGKVSLHNLSYSNGILTGKVENTGTTILEELVLNVFYDDGKSEKINLNNSLNPGELYSLNENIKENFYQIRIITSCPNVFDVISSRDIYKS
jgi:hypothetical protein